jgi:hypothetical protein
MAIAPAHGQVSLLHLKTVPEIYEQIAAFDASRPEAFSPLVEVWPFRACVVNSD